MEVPARAHIRRLSSWLRQRLWAGSVVFLALTVVALAAMGGFFAVRAHAEQTEQARRQAVLQAARQTAVNLTSLNYNSAQKDMRLILEGATGQFKKQLSARTKTFADVLRKAKVNSTGQVQEAGITSIDQDSARVLLAVDATVRNTQAKQGAPRRYRMSMRVEKHDGEWLVSKMRFVQ